MYRNHDFFRQWPKDRLERLCFESRIQEVMHGRVIDPDTANTDTVYFVIEVRYCIFQFADNIPTVFVQFVKDKSQSSK